MDSNELNKFLHEKIMGECWHDWSMTDGDKDFPCDMCRKCRDIAGARIPNYPNYCTDLNAVRKVEEKIEEMTDSEYVRELEYICKATALIKEQGISWDDLLYTLVLATARQRAEACKLAFENTEEKI